MTSRVRELDGLRGIAALVVVVHHSFLAIPSLNGGYFDGEVRGFLPWLLTYTPLHLIWAGGEAVFVFFVLSGFVLTRPFLNARPIWVAYYPSRLLRLYLPVWLSLCFALALIWMMPRAELSGSRWIEAHQTHLSFRELARNFTLYAPSWINSPLWSLKWEVAFSILLPLYVVVARRLAHWWVAVALTAVGLSTLGSALGNAALTYLPIFLIGSAMATVDWSEKNPRWLTPSRRNVLLLLASVGLTARWWLAWLPFFETLSLPVVLSSAALLVILVAGGSRPFGQSVPLALGRISFSLYLVHEPIAVGLALLLPAQLTVLTPLFAIPVAMIAAMFFWRCVELPSHGLARRVSSLLSRGSRSPSFSE